MAKVMWWVMFPILALGSTYMLVTGLALIVHVITGWGWISWSAWRVPAGDELEWVAGYFIGGSIFGGISLLLLKWRKPRRVEGLAEEVKKRSPGLFKF